jgi:hypothetical protein
MAVVGLCGLEELGEEHAESGGDDNDPPRGGGNDADAERVTRGSASNVFCTDGVDGNDTFDSSFSKKDSLRF